MILTIGEILFDIFPDYQRLGGAPFNFSFHLQSLGFPAAFVSRIGNDENGKRILALLEKKAVDSQFIQADPVHPTGHVMVRLNAEGIPDFNIVPDVAYDHLAYESEIQMLLSQDIRLIYYGTLIQRTKTGAGTLMKILENRPPGTKCFYDINLRPACYDKEIIRASLSHCDVLKLSEEELAVLKSMFKVLDDDTMIDYLRDEYSVEWVCLTKGRHGSRLHTPQGIHAASVAKDITPVDTVGAGDAYAAVLAIGYLCGWDPERIISQATEFAGAICKIRGAIPDSSLFYQPFSDRMKGDTF